MRSWPGGADFVTATERAYAAVFGMVQRQAAMLSFNAGFWLLAILFVAIVPCILSWSDRPAAAAYQRTDFAGTWADTHD